MSRALTFAFLEGFSLFHVRGLAARATVESVVADLPGTVLTARTLPDGGFVACLGMREYFLLTPADRPLLQPLRCDEVTVTARCDALIRVSGEKAGLWLRQTSPVNLSGRPQDDFLMSRLLKVGCWLTWAAVDRMPGTGFLIGCDPTYSDYFSEALRQSLQDFAAVRPAA